jgi:hypothetical protein
VPAIGIFGGVHGLERIGAQVVIAGSCKASSAACAGTPRCTANLEQLRLVFVPAVNPGGMLRRTRANPGGVDLMRNAPLDAAGKVPFLIGGHRFSPAALVSGPGRSADGGWKPRRCNGWSPRNC